MIVCRWLIAGLWLAFAAYWAIAAIGAKRSIGGARHWRRQIGVRVAVLIVVLLAVRTSTFAHAWRTVRIHALNTNPVMGLVGLVLCTSGLGLAIWARVHLGRNWGVPMSRKEKPELITSGPYIHVRHPIYGGIILATFGSAIGESLFWAIPLVLGGIYFIHSARREEALLSAQFPQAYPAYMKRTNMFLPFL